MSYNLWQNGICYQTELVFLESFKQTLAIEPHVKPNATY